MSIFVEQNIFLHGFFFNLAMYNNMVFTTPQPYMILNQILVLIYLMLPTTSLSALQRSDIIEELFSKPYSPPVGSGFPVAQSLVICVVVGRSLFLLLYFVCWPVYYPSFGSDYPFFCQCIIRPSVLITRFFASVLSVLRF